ncbi:MAG: DUF448 domain-containing protein [Deltaproteobacteria bacterium]|nr:DUF448 domain-containing protein [Deltaproteobacteria bacterium]
MTAETGQNATARAPKAPKEGTTRACAVCRTESEREVALHFVRAPDGRADRSGAARLAFDVRRKMNARGVNVCPKLACVKKLRPGLPGIQALGKVLPINAEFLDELSATLENDVLDQLGLLRRANALVVGADPAIDALKAFRAHIVMVASDVAERTQRDVKDAIHTVLDQAAWAKTDKLEGTHAWQRNSNVRNPLLVFLPTKVQRLGRALGRDVVGVVAFGEAAFARGKKGERAMQALVARAMLSKALGDRMGESENG